MEALAGQVALVTGAGRGIGRGVSLALARAGARIVLVARTPHQLERVRGEIAAAGGSATAVPADVSREDDVLEAFSRVREEEGRLDILVNNAGVGRFGPIDQFPTDGLDEVLAVNVRGTFLCSREALRLMKPRRSGAIVNISSVVGVKGYPDQSAYGASKHAIQGITKALAVEAQPYGIRVSAVLPGGVDTELVARARPDIDRSELLRPEDIAEVVLFLLTLPGRAAIDEIRIRRRASAPW